MKLFHRYRHSIRVQLIHHTRNLSLSLSRVKVNWADSSTNPRRSVNEAKLRLYRIFSVNERPKVSDSSMSQAEMTIHSSPGGPSTVPTIVKPANSGLSVLGYDDVKSTPINPKIRQELDYLDREVREKTLPDRIESSLRLGIVARHCPSI